MTPPGTICQPPSASSRPGCWMSARTPILPSTWPSSGACARTPSRSPTWPGWASFPTSRCPQGKNSPIDVMAAHMEAKMAYKPGERDMIVMQHEFVAEYPGPQGSHHGHHDRLWHPQRRHLHGPHRGPAGRHRRAIDPAGQFAGLTGVHVPVIPEIYEPVLAELAELGIGLTETSRADRGDRPRRGPTPAWIWVSSASQPGSRPSDYAYKSR